VQVYRELNIGAAKPSLTERLGVPHHLLDELDLTEPFTAARFRERAAALAAEIRSRGRIPIVSGGTGLYLRGLLDGFTFAAGGNGESAARRAAAARLTPETLHRRLSALDPISAARLHPHDTARLTRALEVFDLTGRPLSAQRSYAERVYPPLPGVFFFGLTAPRPWLYERINARAEAMLEGGLIEETAALLRAGRRRNLKPLGSIGYRHAIAYLRGMSTRAETLRLLQRDTRRLAKRQWTWFRRDPRVIWLDVTESPLEALTARMLAHLSAGGLAGGD
jgi:tRNA dimethylallyltransferase